VGKGIGADARLVDGDRHLEGITGVVARLPGLVEEYGTPRSYFLFSPLPFIIARTTATRSALPARFSDAVDVC